MATQVDYTIHEETWTEANTESWTDKGVITWNNTREFTYTVTTDTLCALGDIFTKISYDGERTFTEDMVPGDDNKYLFILGVTGWIETHSDGFTIAQDSDTREFIKSVAYSVGIGESATGAADYVRIAAESLVGSFLEYSHAGRYYELDPWVLGFEVSDSDKMLFTLETLVGMENLIYQDDIVFKGGDRDSVVGLSDMYMRSQPFTDQYDFLDEAENPHIPGYNKFSNFIQGDYTYKNAMVRTVMTTDNREHRIRLLQLKLEIDLPDLIQRGRVTLTSANKATGAYVPFDIPFNVKFPEDSDNLFIWPVQVSGTQSGICEIVDYDPNGFTVRMHDGGTPTPTYLEGVVNWTAHGY